MSDSSSNYYAKILKKRKWLAERAKPYPDFSMKDTLVLLEFSSLQCVYEEPTKIIQFTHSTTVTRAYYTCGNISTRESYAYIDFSHLTLYSTYS